MRGAAAPAAEGGPRLRAAFFCGGLGAAFFCGGLDSASRHSCSSRFRASISRRCPLHDAQSGLPFPSQAAFASDIPVRGGWAADELLAGPWAQKCRPWGLHTAVLYNLVKPAGVACWVEADAGGGAW